MDRVIFQAIHNLAGHYVILDLLIVFAAQYLPYIIFAAFLFLVFWKKNWHERFNVIFLSALSLLIGRGVVVEIIRFFYPRIRPFLVLGFDPLIKNINSASFPSGHAVVLFILSSLIYFINRRFFVYFLLGATINVLARIYVGVHWPSDILTGAVLGFLIPVFIEKILPKTTGK